MLGMLNQKHTCCDHIMFFCVFYSWGDQTQHMAAMLRWCSQYH